MSDKIPELYLILHERIVDKYRAGTIVTSDSIRRFIAMVGRVPHCRINRVMIEMCEYGLLDMESPINYHVNRF